MSDNCKERTYYIRTVCMYMDLTKDTLLKLFKYLLKTDNITQFLANVETGWKLRDLFKDDLLNKTEYNLVRSSWPDPEKFDIALLIRLIIGLCKSNITEPHLGWKNKPQPKDESLGADLIRLRDVRNKIIGHRAEAKLSQVEYERTWGKVQAVLVRVVEKIEPESGNEFVTKLEGYKQLDIDTTQAKVKQYLDQLTEYQRDSEKLQNKIEELSEKIKEFHVYFQTTPERYVRYIKLLFEGGRLVLCGVFERELPKYGKGLISLVFENKETLQAGIDRENQSHIFPSEPDTINHANWDVDLLASVTLLVFTDINTDDISNIEQIKLARLNYAENAFICLDTDEFLLIWTDLISSLKHLSMNIDERKKRQVDGFIELYKKKSEVVDADEYLDQLRKRGVPVKTLKDIHSDTVDKLRKLLRRSHDLGINFKNGHVLDLKILTVCDNEEVKKHAEDFLERHLEASLHGSNQPNIFIGAETDELVASITNHPDVKPTGIKRGCIILSFRSSTPAGTLHLLDYLESQHFNERLHNISKELNYLYEESFLMIGHATLESIHSVGSKENSSENGLNISLKYASVEGLRHVLTTLKSDKTTNRLNSIADKISAELKETVTITVFPDLLSFRDVFGKKDSEKKVYRGNYEDKAFGRYSEKENRNRRAFTISGSIEQIPGVSSESNLLDEDAAGESVLLQEKKVSRGNYEDEAFGRYSEKEKRNRHADTLSGSMEQLLISGVSHESTLMDTDDSVFLGEKRVPRGNYKDEAFDRYSEKENINRREDAISGSIEQISGVSPESTLVDEYYSVIPLDSEKNVSCDSYEDEASGEFSERENRNRSAYTIRESFEELLKSSVSQERALVDEDVSWLLREPVEETTERRDFREAKSNFELGILKRTGLSLKDFDKSLDVAGNYFQQMMKYPSNLTEEDLQIFEAAIEDLFHLIIDETKVKSERTGLFSRFRFYYPRQEPQQIDRKIRLAILRENFTSFKRSIMIKGTSEDEIYNTKKKEPVIEMAKEREFHEGKSNFELGLLKSAGFSMKDFDSSFDVAEMNFKQMMKNASNLTEEELKIFEATIEHLFHLLNDESKSKTERLVRWPHYFYLNQEQLRVENKSSRLDELRKEFTSFKRSIMMKVISEDEIYKTKKKELRDFLIRTYKEMFAETVYHKRLVAYRQPLLHVVAQGGYSYYDIENRNYKNIYVVGEERLATLFCRNLVTDWCDEKSSDKGCQRHMCPICKSKINVDVDEFEFIFMISLCDVGNEVFIPNMVKQSLLRGDNVEIFEKVLERESEKCLILLDGLSRWDAKVHSNKEMPQRKSMDDYVVLTTANRREIETKSDQVIFSVW